MKRLFDLCALIAALTLAPPAVHASNDFDVCRRYDLQQLARQGTTGSPEAEYCLGFGSNRFSGPGTDAYFDHNSDYWRNRRWEERPH